MPQTSAPGNSLTILRANLQAREGRVFDNTRIRKLVIAVVHPRKLILARRLPVTERRTRDLISISVAITREECKENDSEIEEEIPILQVIEIMLNAAANGSVATPAINLRPTRDTDFEAVA